MKNRGCYTFLVFWPYQLSPTYNLLNLCRRQWNCFLGWQRIAKTIDPYCNAQPIPVNNNGSDSWFNLVRVWNQSPTTYIVFLYLLLKLNSSTPHDSKFNQLEEIILIKRLPPYNVSPFRILHLNYLYICKNLLDALPHHNRNKKKRQNKIVRGIYMATFNADTAHAVTQ